MVDPGVVAGLLSTTRAYVGFLKEASKMPLEEFKRNQERQLAVLHALQLAIEGCLSVGSHIIGSEGYGTPKDYAGVFEILASRGVLEREFADRLKKMAGFRNRIVHVYWDVDLDEVHAILQRDLGDFDEFISVVGGLLNGH